MEFIIGTVAVIVLLLSCFSGSAKKNQSRYFISDTADERYCEVIDNQTGSVAFVGTREQCEHWTQQHD